MKVAAALWSSTAVEPLRLPALDAFKSARSKLKRLQNNRRCTERKRHPLTPEKIAQRTVKVASTRRAKLNAFVTQLFAEYSAGATLYSLGKKYDRNASCIRELLQRRGYPIRPSRPRARPPQSNGCFAPGPKLTDAQIEQLIAGATRISVPEPLKTEWRDWPMERRRWFIERLRARLPKGQRPCTPFSANVTPFDYWTPAAREIQERLSAGKDSRTSPVKIKPVSQGVIWRGSLWFWSPKVGYQQGPFTAENGRPALHHVIWEEAHGRPVPPHHVIRFVDGNPNNLVPENLVLAHRNEVARENQFTSLTRKSRERTALLLARSQRPKKEASHDYLAALSR